MDSIKNDLKRLALLNKKNKEALYEFNGGLSDDLTSSISLEEIGERLDLLLAYKDPINSIQGLPGYLLELRYLEGLSVEVIKEVVGLSEGHIYRVLNQATKKLIGRIKK